LVFWHFTVSFPVFFVGDELPQAGHLVVWLVEEAAPSLIQRSGDELDESDLRLGNIGASAVHKGTDRET
jgi:hypothetical protein